MNKFTQQTSTPVVTTPPANYADKQFLHTFQVGVWLPLVQASIIAMMSMVGTGVGLYLFDAVDYVKPLLVMFVLTWIMTFLYLMRRWLNLTAFERMTGIDLNGDGVIGKKKPVEPLVIRIDDVRDGRYRSREVKLDVTEEQLQEFARGSLNGISFTERNWTGRGKPFSSGQDGTFRPFRSMWLKQGLVEVVSDKDNRQGFEFTDTGWAMLEKLADHPDPSVTGYGDIPPNGERASQFGGRGDEVPDLTDEQWTAIERENAAHAEKYQS